MTLEQQADLLAGNLRGWEQSAIQRIARRVGKYGKMSLADVKSINNIYVVNQDMEAITGELAQVSGKNIAEIEQMYGDLLAEQHLQNNPLYDYRNRPFVPFAENKELQAIVRAYSNTTAETMVNLSKTKMLCTRNAKGQWVNMAKSYHQVLDQAVMQVTTGTTDFYTAMRESVLQLGGSGINVDYGGGVMRRLDTVVRQNLLWGAKQASIEYNEMIGQELGCDGYEIDWHSNPRPSHEFMQGKQYSTNGTVTIGGVKYLDFYKAIESDRSPDEALNEYGCLHYTAPIICGVSEPRYSSQELSRLNAENAKKYEINGKEVSGYEATQMQRRIETEIRKCKDEINALQGLGNSEQQIKDLRKRIKVFQGKYNEISEITGIAKQPKRMSVPRIKK